VVLRQLVELPPGAYAPGGPNEASSFLLPPPAISQGLGPGHGGEQLDVQELIPEPAVERLAKAPLPR